MNKLVPVSVVADMRTQSACYMSQAEVRRDDSDTAEAEMVRVAQMLGVGL